MTRRQDGQPMVERPSLTRRGEGATDAQHALARIARRIALDLARDGLLLAFHHDMPESTPLLGVDMEVMEGRDDGEAVLVRNRHLFERGGRTEITLRPRHDHEVAESVMRWLEPALEQMRRERDVRRRGGDPLHPHAADLRAHPLLASAMTWLDPHWGGLVVDRRAGGGVVQRKGGTATGRIAMRTFRVERNGVGVSCELDLSGDRLMAHAVTIATPTVRMRISDVDREVAELSVSGALLPRAAVGALAGRTLADVVDHPCLRTARALRISTAEQAADAFGDGRLRLEIRADAVPLVGATV